MWEPLIICGVTPGPGENAAYTHECGYADIFILIKHIITDLVLISTLLVVVSLVWAGFKLLTAGGNPGALKDAIGMLGKIVTGYIVILAAWLIVYTLSSTLLKPEFYDLLGPVKTQTNIH